MKTRLANKEAAFTGCGKTVPCCHSERSEESRPAHFHGNTRFFVVCGSSPESGRVSCLDSANSSHACRVHFLESQIACVRLSRLRMTGPTVFPAASEGRLCENHRVPGFSHRLLPGQRRRRLALPWRCPRLLDRSPAGIKARSHCRQEEQLQRPPTTILFMEIAGYQ